MVKINVRLPQTLRVSRRTRYLAITMKGVQFVKKWYTAEHIPFNLTRLYRLLLRLIWMKGSMTTNFAWRLGYSTDVLKRANSDGYVEINNRPSRPLRAVRNKIDAMIGKAPRCIYA